MRLRVASIRHVTKSSTLGTEVAAGRADANNNEDVRLNVLSYPRLAYLVLLVSFFAGATAPAAAGQKDAISFENFESYEVGATPDRWKFFTRRDREFLPLEEFMAKDERFYVVSERGNKFLRGYTRDEAQRISLGNQQAGLNWRLSEHPLLAWRWRANKLPVGAREDGKNDAGGAVYVTFPKKDWLGRPYSIKYTYSSTLPVDREVDSGPVKVVVVSSGADGIGEWKRIERNVREDYRRLFGSSPPDEPFSVTLWSDTDDTGGEAEVDFDDIRVVR